MSHIVENLQTIRDQIVSSAHQAGRKPETIQLVAISKKHSVEAMREAWDAGQSAFGESRLQEALTKIPLLPSKLRWHFIGHLQTNKIRKALPHFSLFHGVDTLEVARQMNRIAAEIGEFPRILLEVNVAEEATKFGFTPEDLRVKVEELLALPRLQIMGLMAMAPFRQKPEETRPFFAAVRHLRDELEKQTGTPLPELSMGMSNDFKQAIVEGATIVRIGTAIFGERHN